jgi:hypothetical protein
VRPDVRLSQDPAGLARGDRDLMLSGQAGPLFHRAHALGQVAAAGGADGARMTACTGRDLRVRELSQPASRENEIVRVRPRMPGSALRHAKERRCATPKPMPVPARKLKDQVEDDLDHYASQRWPQPEEITIRWHGSYGYVTGYVTEDDGIPLCWITCTGSPDDRKGAFRPPRP